MKKEFEEFYRVLIPNLNRCNNCQILKCFYCMKFNSSCSLCRHERCKHYVKYNNSINFFYEHCTEMQWSYICNFVHDLCNLSWITKSMFTDVQRPIYSSVNKTAFLCSSNRFLSVNRNNKNNIYYMLGNKKYKFYKK